MYQTTLPSFFAAAINSGVTGVAGGGADNTRVENDAPAASAPEPTSTSRRENFEPFMRILPDFAFVVSPRLFFHPSSARHLSGGSCSQTALPSGMLSPAAVTTRNDAPPLSSTI